MSLAEENKSILQRAIEHFNDQESRTAYFELYAPGAVLHGYPGVEPGLESIERFYNAFWRAFPDCHIVLHDVVSEGDEVGCRFVLNATHQGDFMGIPPTGRQVTLAGATILRFTDGKCVERWSQADFLGLMQQLGAVPDQAGLQARTGEVGNLPEENKAIVRRLVDEAQSGGNVEAVDELLAEDFVDHSAFPGFSPTREGVKQLFAALHAAFRDFHAIIHEQVAEGKKVATRKTFHGVHQGEFMGVPPTGNRVAFDVIDILYVEGGRITDHWTQVDLLGLIRQLGLIPEH